MQMHFAAPAKGNEKGAVEGTHGFVEDNFFRPTRSGENLKSINEELRLFCMADGNKKRVLLDEEKSFLTPIPSLLPDTARSIAVKINKFAEINFATNRYSVPTAYAHRNGLLRVYSDHITISVGDEEIARHARSFQRRAAVLEPLHYVDILESKHRSVERAEVFTTDKFPDELKQLLRVYVDEDRDSAGKQFMRVIRLFHFYDTGDIVRAASTAYNRGTSDPAASELLLQQGTYSYRNPEPLNLARKAQIFSTDLSQYSASILQEHFL
jgi:hypothetical protein